MINALKYYYGLDNEDPIKQLFRQDFCHADRVMVKVIIAYSLVIAFLTSSQFGYYTLGISCGLLFSGIAIVAYKMMAGTVFCRLLMGFLLTAIMAVTIQQAGGLGEGHFVFFINFAILMRYRDLLPLLAMIVSTVVHHLVFTYCQAQSVEVSDVAIQIFSWGSESQLGLFAPLFYHVACALFATAVSTYYIHDGVVGFIERSLISHYMAQANDGDIASAKDMKSIDSNLLLAVSTFFQGFIHIIDRLKFIGNDLDQRASEYAKDAEQTADDIDTQFRELSDLMESINGMNTASTDIAKNAEQTAEISKQAEDNSQSGNEKSTRSVSSIESLSTNISESMITVEKLLKHNNDINSIVKTINDIAEQTNLLALNAAIEAARAGDQGRGFAVVADEVRVLSQRTQASTLEISDTINTLQSTSKEVMMLMEKSQSFASQSVTDATSAAESFQQISEGISEILESVTLIASAAEEQTQVTSTINSNTRELHNLSSASMETAKENKQSSDSLQQQSDEMLSLLKHFK